jgi:hypothetical protein
MTPPEPESIAQIIDTFFNGRAAPAALPQPVRIKLNSTQIGELMQGRTLHFQAGPLAIELVAAKK